MIDEPPDKYLHRRLVPDIPLPPYTFVPRRTPHPRTDPAGHAYGIKTPRPDPVDPSNWCQSRTYLYGVDLFNRQYYWEAHEQFEGLWLAAGRTGPVADLLKGLIKLAAAGVKYLEQKPEGVRSHASRAAELFGALERSNGDGPFLGFPLACLISLAAGIGRDGWPDSPPLLTPTTRD